MTRRSSMQSSVVVVAMLVLLASVRLAQGQSDAHPSFEVATLKQVADNAVANVTIFPRQNGDRFTWDTSLASLLSYAYRIPWSRIAGIEADKHSYSVVATMDPSTTEEQARLMLQSLLVEKLKMTAHRETREVPGYALVVAKNGPKMKEAGASGGPPPMPDDMKNVPAASGKGRIFTFIPERGVLAPIGRGVPISQLADELSKDLKIPVVDRTGLTGKYYFELKFQMPDVQLSANPSEFAAAADISSALPDQLGLRLQKQTVSADFLVVEHFEPPVPE